MKAGLLASACAAAIVVTAAPANAQDIPTVSDTQDGAADRQDADEAAPAQGNEVIVTATRRAERLQDVPLSVTAYNQEQLNDLGIVGFEGIAQNTPGVVVNRPTQNFNNFTSRGINTNGYSAGLQSAVAIYVDELPISAGAKLVLPGRHADGASLARLINAEAVTVAVGVPTVWLGLVEHLDAVGGDVPTLERVVVGGMPIAPALMARIERRLGVTVQTSWGMTELSPSGTVAPPDDPSRAAELSGRVAVGVDMLLTDENGKALAAARCRRAFAGARRRRGRALFRP